MLVFFLTPSQAQAAADLSDDTACVSPIEVTSEESPVKGSPLFFIPQAIEDDPAFGRWNDMLSEMVAYDVDLSQLIAYPAFPA